ncbi:hypothetical protein [Azospirillum brasilense]|uniref:hypothetical protein n=1 Tax=Azospirillum brasilense TaxID=192 RepID=UPI000E694D20|nr:hypothetical protein [Azospirillum brasilense]NUB25756.1 hypothetical protein [Azospirillum brasilense]NUB33894.1 hypothetical protein [Azospirillum brasilense]RIW07734.1 hypothetical protein D2T81_02530 [Azospirillum brasilense]
MQDPKLELTNSSLITSRVVLHDVPGQPLAVALHDADDQSLKFELEPLDALAFAVDLITSARRRLAGGGL